jgi:hypothetical protein
MLSSSFLCSILLVIPYLPLGKARTSPRSDPPVPLGLNFLSIQPAHNALWYKEL